MAKPDLGLKRQCPSCGARFYDLNKRPITCPKCTFSFEPEMLLKSRRPRAAEKLKAVEAPVAEAERDTEELEEELEDEETEEEEVEEVEEAETELPETAAVEEEETEDTPGPVRRGEEVDPDLIEVDEADLDGDAEEDDALIEDDEDDDSAEIDIDIADDKDEER